jgi:hypothetical protein
MMMGFVENIYQREMPAKLVLSFLSSPWRQKQALSFQQKVMRLSTMEAHPIMTIDMDDDMTVRKNPMNFHHCICSIMTLLPNQ